MKNSRLKITLYSLSYLLPLTTFLGFLWGGMASYLSLILVFIITPLFDLLCGTDSLPFSVSSTIHQDQHDLNCEKSYRTLLYLYPFVQWGLLLWGASLAAQRPFFDYQGLGMIFSLGLVSGGMGINIAHELIHKVSPWERRTGDLLLLGMGYMHFSLDHRKGHHKQVATPEDPNTAQKGESLYTFLPMSVWGGYRRAWKLGRRMLVLNMSFPVLLSLWLGFQWGIKAVLLYIGQSVMAIMLLEVTNYIQHYGLKRKKLPSGLYEKVSAKHSWSANILPSNYFLFQLPRHADHHIRPLKRYQHLLHLAEAPHLPYGYPLMIFISFIPPLWRKVMDPLLDHERIIPFTSAQEQSSNRP